MTGQGVRSGRSVPTGLRQRSHPGILTDLITLRHSRGNCPRDGIPYNLSRSPWRGPVTLTTGLAFVSYSRQDKEFALKVANDLKAAKAMVWMDQLELTPGDRWDRAVQDALQKASIVVVILSPEAVSSDNVLDEVSFAHDEKKTVVPVLYRDCTVPLRLRRLHYVGA